MARTDTIFVGALNISANPHPNEIYIATLRAATRFVVNARGTDYAKITTPRKDVKSANLYLGRVLVWTEINKMGRWLDTTKEEELSEEQLAAIRIPDNAKPNFRTFDYVFNTENHRLCFEAVNEQGDKLGPTTAQRIFKNLLSRDTLGTDSPEFAVSIVPRAGTVDVIFRLPQLRILEIRVERANADTASPDAVKRVNEYLDKLNAQRVQQTFVKANNASRLTPTQEIRDFAEVAAENGNVKGIGKSSDGSKTEVSTEGRPKLLPVPVSDGSNLLTRIRSIIHLF